MAALTGVTGLGLWSAIAIAGPSRAPPPAVSLAYETQVDDTGVTRLDDGGWSVTNDLGVEVTVESYVVRTWSAVVNACDDDTGTGGLALVDVVSVDVAAAGHSEAPDPAQAEGPVEEDLTTATSEAVGLGEGAIEADAVCAAHVAVAGGEGTSDGRTQPTIEVTGTYQGPDDPDPIPFVVTSDQAWGGVIQLDRTELEGDSLPVVITRDLGSLFDGVGFDADEGERAVAMLQALTAATWVDVAEPS